MPGRLDRKVAVITGGTSGIGEATARMFVAEGARIVIAGRSEQRGNALSSELGQQAVFFRADGRHRGAALGAAGAGTHRELLGSMRGRG